MSAPAYWDYLKLDRLLDLQSGLEGDEESLAPDELHFIVVHQVFELWFKLMLREIRLARDHLSAPKVPEERVPYVVHHLRRANEALRQAISHFSLVETLTPQDFLAFRDKLVPASGFQSFQMREIEILLGLEDEHRLPYGGTDPLDHIRTLPKTTEAGRLAWERVRRAREETTLRAALHEWLYRTPIQGSAPEDGDDDETVLTFLSEYLEAGSSQHRAMMERLIDSGVGDEETLKGRFAATEQGTREFILAADQPAESRERMRRIRAALVFIESYRDLPLLAWPRTLLDTIAELEERLVLFRTRHARMVERVIGRRVGTGGSSGVDYLDETARYRVFPEIWSVRTVLLPRECLPALRHPEVYGFVS
jgi:tryptophan 2,3-dioxygenase